MNKLKTALKILLLGGVMGALIVGNFISKILHLDKEVSADHPGDNWNDAGGGGGGGGDDS